MRPRGFLSPFELMALLDVARQGGSAYGAQIARNISVTAKRVVARASVYAALARLERRGFVKCALGQATAKRGGKAKPTYTITKQGLRSAYEAKTIIVELSVGLPALTPQGKPSPVGDRPVV